MEIKIFKSMSAVVDIDTVREIIRADIENQTGYKVKKLEFNMVDRWIGYGPDEYKTPEISGVTVYFSGDH